MVSSVCECVKAIKTGQRSKESKAKHKGIIQEHHKNVKIKLQKYVTHSKQWQPRKQQQLSPKIKQEKSGGGRQKGTEMERNNGKLTQAQWQQKQKQKQRIQNDGAAERGEKVTK